MSTKSLPRRGFVAAIGLLAIAACSAEPPPGAAQAPSSAAAVSSSAESSAAVSSAVVSSPASAPAAAAPVAPPAATPTTSATPTPAIRVPVKYAPVIGPTGYGSLTLGMTLRQAVDTGRVLPPDQLSDVAEPCRLLRVPGQVTGLRVGLIDGVGVVSIPGYGGARTPEDIGPGSTRAQVKRTYPGFREWSGGIAVAVPGHPANQYAFDFGGADLDDDRVGSVELSVKDRGCAG